MDIFCILAMHSFVGEMMLSQDGQRLFLRPEEKAK